MTPVTTLTQQSTEKMKLSAIQNATHTPALLVLRHPTAIPSMSISFHNYTMQSYLPNEWSDAEYRETYLDSHLEHIIGWQIRVNREARGLTQKGLAALCNTKQPVISRLESAESSGYSIATLLKIAHAFKCALEVKFIPYSKFANNIQDNSPKALYAEPFQDTYTNKFTSGDTYGK